MIDDNIKKLLEEKVDRKKIIKIEAEFKSNFGPAHKYKYKYECNDFSVYADGAIKDCGLRVGLATVNLNDEEKVYIYKSLREFYTDAYKLQGREELRKFVENKQTNINNPIESTDTKEKILINAIENVLFGSPIKGDLLEDKNMGDGIYSYLNNNVEDPGIIYKWKFSLEHALKEVM